MYDQRGTLLHVTRVPGTPDPVRPEELERELERRLEAAPPIEEVRAGIRAAFEATPVPDTKPFFDRLLIDNEGYTWVRREAGSSQSGGRWDIIAPDGRWMGSLRTPPALEITQVGNDFVIGIRTAEDGVEDIRLFRLSRSSPR